MEVIQNMKTSIKTICPKCGAKLPYRAVTLKEIKKPHKPYSIGAYCGKCGAKLISE
jgi:ribosomal protein L40E